MKKTFLNFAINLIKKNNPHLNEIKLEEIKYGLEGIYLTISKLIIILSISLLLGIIKEFLLFLLLYNVIRLFAFGMHASKSSICLTISIFIFILFPYILRILIIPFNLKIIISIFCLLAIILYAPADTHKRPLINKKKRFIFKILSIVITIIYIILSFNLNNTFITNSLLIALLIEVILILPITYKIFKLPYNNYKTYSLNLNN